MDWGIKGRQKKKRKKERREAWSIGFAVMANIFADGGIANNGAGCGRSAKARPSS